jgi:hypothetical protein
VPVAASSIHRGVRRSARSDSATGAMLRLSSGPIGTCFQKKACDACHPPVASGPRRSVRSPWAESILADWTMETHESSNPPNTTCTRRSGPSRSCRGQDRAGSLVMFTFSRAKRGGNAAIEQPSTKETVRLQSLVRPSSPFPQIYDDERGLLELPPLSCLRLRASKSFTSIFIKSDASGLSPRRARIRSRCCSS